MSAGTALVARIQRQASSPPTSATAVPTTIARTYPTVHIAGPTASRVARYFRGENSATRVVAIV